ncbi:MAG: hypothetical protein L0Y56_19215, partial [Nitrospira sp.]|nr:hypothetical protein [Nitrospira sp.]
MLLSAAEKFLSRLPLVHRVTREQVPFILNHNQKKFLEIVREKQESKGLPFRVICLKSRRVGVSSLMEGLGFLHCVAKANANGLIAAHDADSVVELFRVPLGMVDGFPTHLPPATQRKITIPHEKGDSTLSIATAGNIQGGRGSGRSFLHACLRGDALINTLDGRFKRIDELCQGDFIRTHTGKLAEVLYITSKQCEKQSVELRTWLNINRLTLTEDHKVWTARGWVEAGKLIPNQDEIGFALRKFDNT